MLRQLYISKISGLIVTNRDRKRSICQWNASTDYKKRPHPIMSGHKFALYRSDPQVDVLEDRANLYIPRIDLPDPPPRVINITLEWMERNQD